MVIVVVGLFVFVIVVVVVIVVVLGVVVVVVVVVVVFGCWLFFLVKNQQLHNPFGKMVQRLMAVHVTLL